jgi:hypothetical protein
LLKGLSSLCSTQTGLTFAAKMYLNGQYEGNTILYESNCYPFKCIGPVRYLWEQVDINDPESFRKLWIWSHPAISQQLEKQFNYVFNLNEEEKDDDSPVNKRRKNNIYLTLLKDRLVRFKLLGPLSTIILANVLKPVDFQDDNSL